jgi:hypothetical protein
MKEHFYNDKKVVQNLLKKFGFITELKLLFVRELNYNLFELIVNNCKHLRTLYMRAQFEGFDLFESKVSQEFCQKLTSIEIYYINDQQLRKLLALTQNLKTIRLTNSHLNVIMDPILTKLEEIHSYIYNLNDFKSFKRFSHLYNKKIKKFSTHLDIDSINDMLIELSRFQSLMELNIDFDLKNSFIENELILIGNKCKQLEKVAINAPKYQFKSNLLEVFSGFYALKKLSIIGFSYIKGFGNIKCLQNCHNFESLKLYLYCEFTDKKDLDFDDIHLYLPNLRQLSLNNNFTSYRINDKTLKNLAKLQKLSKLLIGSIKMTSSGVKEFIENSPNIKTIKLCHNYINDTTIEAFNERAKLNPKIRFKFLNLNWSQKNERKLVPNLTLR